MLKPGLYEQVINKVLQSELAEMAETRKSTAPIDSAEASKILSQYIAEVFVQYAKGRPLQNEGALLPPFPSPKTRALTIYLA